MTKKIYFIIFVTIFSCENSNDSIKKETIDQNILSGSWNLVQVSGGLKGVDKKYLKNEVKWVFEKDGTLQVVRSIENDFLSLNNGQYTYSILKNDSKYFLKIDSYEYGNIQVINERVTIDRNLYSTGGGADGYIVHMEK